MSRPLRTLLVLVLVAGAFAYGAAFAHWKLFPYERLAALARRGGPPAAAATTTAPGGEHMGWWEPAQEQPSGADIDAHALEIGRIGYGQAYKTSSGGATGVTVYDRDRAQAGYNLIVSAHQPVAQLCDMEGEVLHEWRCDYASIPHEPGDFRPLGPKGEQYFRRARLLDDGSLIAVYDRTAIVKLDRDSKLVWWLHGDYHHDLDVTPDGSIWVLAREDHVIPRFSTETPTAEDFVVHIGPDGKILGKTSLLAAFENSPYAAFLEKATPGGDIFHTNTLSILDGSLASLSPHFAAGRALVSIWGLDVVAVVDLEEGRVDWALSGMWHRQHDPQLLPNGHLLVFDNLWQTHDKGGKSQVIEVDPLTQQIVWTYSQPGWNDFFSALCGAVQRLANGDTLITESLAGRAFEVTPSGETVWRWVTPYTIQDPRGVGIAVLMDVVRLPPDLPVASWRSPTPPSPTPRSR